MRRAIGARWWPRTWRVLAIVFVLTVALPSRPFAHEIPPSVMVLAYVKPEPGRLRLVVRVPLESIRDFELVLRGPGYLDLPSVNPELKNAGRLWIADYVEVFENDRPLERRQVTAARLSLPSDRSFTSYDTALGNLSYAFGRGLMLAAFAWGGWSEVLPGLNVSVALSNSNAP